MSTSSGQREMIPIDRCILLSSRGASWIRPLVIYAPNIGLTPHLKYNIVLSCHITLSAFHMAHYTDICYQSGVGYLPRCHLPRSSDKMVIGGDIQVPCVSVNKRL